ncbi:MAG TPA: type VI secretion system tube protein Hcp [Candidatus Acidoferrum sp.]|nr:type VI secretion system tube protein Hcp [Candidatus Acidoferrum sp.]
MSGASTNPMYKDWIVIRSVSNVPSPNDGAADRESSSPSVSELTATRTGAPGAQVKPGTVAPRDQASGMAAGKRMHKPITITKEIDKASPLLHEATDHGQSLSEVEVVLTGGSSHSHFILRDVMVTSLQTASGDKPKESVTFTFQKIEFLN